MSKQHLINDLLSVQACPEDAFNEILNELKFSFEGLPSNVNLKPSLTPQAQTTTVHPVCVFCCLNFLALRKYQFVHLQLSFFYF